MRPAITLVALSTASPGRPLLVLGPSLGTGAEALWGRCAAELADRFDVLGWELPGHGRGAPTAEPFTVEDLAAGVLAAVDEARGPGAEFAYAGDSVGGAVGLALLLHHPARVRAATLACTAARIGTAQQWSERVEAVRADGTSSLLESSAARWFGPGFRDRQPEVADRLLDSLAGADVESYAQACQALAAFDVRDRLDSLRGPLTLIGGAHDAVTPIEGLRAIAAAAPGSVLVELDVAHLAPAEDPVTVAALIAANASAPAPAPSGQARAEGMRVRREVAGEEWVDRAVAATTPFTRDFQELITQYAWGSVWARPGLDRRSRSMITLTALIARGHHEELAMHLRAALTNGLTREEISEVLIHAAIYCGVPDANTAFRVASGVFADLDASAATGNVNPESAEADGSA